MISFPRERLHYNRIIPSIILILFCMTIFVPRLIVGRFEIGLDDFMAAIFLPIMFSYVFVNPNAWILRGRRLFLLLLWVILILTGIVFSMLGSLTYLDRVCFPTEMWQYVKRMIFFFSALYFAYTGAVSSKSFYNILLYTLLVALLIGIIQFIPCSIGEYLSHIYARTYMQWERLIERPFYISRNYGVAGFATAWGGFGMFSAAVALSGLLPNSAGQTWLKYLLFFMAFINVLFSGSKVAAVAFFTVVIFFILVGLFTKKNRVSFFLKYSVIFSIGALIINHFFWDKLDYIFFRYRVLVDRVGGARVDQVKSALSLLDGWYAILFGVGNAAHRELAVSFGTEVEPVYLMVNYGFLGITLRYGLLLIICFYSYGLMKRVSGDDKALAIAAMLSISGYMVFSLGYFFYQEIYVGMLPWLLFGWVVGSYYQVVRANNN